MVIIDGPGLKPEFLDLPHLLKQQQQQRKKSFSTAKAEKLKSTSSSNNNKIGEMIRKKLNERQSLDRPELSRFTRSVEGINETTASPASMAKTIEASPPPSPPCGHIPALPRDAWGSSAAFVGGAAVACGGGDEGRAGCLVYAEFARQWRDVKLRMRYGRTGAAAIALEEDKVVLGSIAHVYNAAV